MPILNLTQHEATSEQVAAGVVDMPVNFRSWAKSFMTFDTLPTREEVKKAAECLVALVRMLEHEGQVMIGGAPFLMPHLEAELIENGYDPVYAFSKRESVDQPQPDGTVRKVAVFRHAGFVNT